MAKNINIYENETKKKENNNNNTVGDINGRLNKPKMTDLKYLIEGEREEHLEKKIINTDSSSHLNISHERSSDYLVHIGSKLRMN